MMKGPAVTLTLQEKVKAWVQNTANQHMGIKMKT